MSKAKKKDIGSNRPATKGDIEQLREDFQSDLVNHTYSKEELDVKFEQNKQEIKREIVQELSKKADQNKQEIKREIVRELTKKTDQDKQEIIHEFHVSVEQNRADLQGAHEDEMASVEGRKDAPAQWKSMPRRLKAVEMDVEKIKDHLEIG